MTPERRRKRWAGSFPYLPNHGAESLARLCGLIQQRPPHQRSSNRPGVQAGLRPRVRGHCVKAARLALPFRPVEGLAEAQKPERTRLVSQRLTFANPAHALGRSTGVDQLHPALPRGKGGEVIAHPYR